MRINYKKFVRAIIVLILIIALIVFIIGQIIGAITGNSENNKENESTSQEPTEVEANYENNDIEYYEEEVIEPNLSKEEMLINKLTTNIALSNEYYLYSDEEMRNKYDIANYSSAFGFVIVDKTKDTYTEIAVINLNNEQNLDAVQNTVLSKMIQRNEVIKDENKNQYADLFKNRANFLMKIQNGIAVFVVSTQKDAIERIIDENYIN